MTAAYLEDFNSDVETNDAEQIPTFQSNTKRTRSKNFDYELLKTFNDEKEALKWLKNENVWGPSFTNWPSEGWKDLKINSHLKYTCFTIQILMKYRCIPI